MSAVKVELNYFEDLKASGYVRHELRDPYFAFVNRTHKTAFVFDRREVAQDAFERGIQGKIWIDHTGAWNVEYAKSKTENYKATYLPINEVLPLIGYKIE